MLATSAALFLFFMASPIFAVDTFTSDLHVGVSGPEVKLLQVFLNSNLSTIVAEVGSGSKGSETEYFGELTKTAVIRFQELHASEILVPVGLSTGSGFVGAFTRGVLNKLIAFPALPSAASLPAPTIPYKNPYSTSTNYFATSSLLMLTPYLPASFKITDIASTIIKVQIQALMDISAAVDNLYKKETSIDLGASTTAAFATSSIMDKIKPGRIAPKISILAKPESITDMMSVRGTGLVKTNSVYTSIGHIDDLPLVGTSTLIFKLSNIPEFAGYLSAGVSHNATTSVYVWVVNENGVSNVEGPIIIKL